MDENCEVCAIGAPFCRLQCEISSVTVTGLGCTGGARELFLRCHVPAGGGRTTQIDNHSAEFETRGLDGGGDYSGGRSRTGAEVVSWRGVASLRCDGSPACVREVAERGGAVFEVRRRRRWRAILGSELVGRAEVAWRDATVAAGGAAVERRVALAAPARGRGLTVIGDDGAAPVMSVSMSVRVSETVAPTVPVGQRMRSAARQGASGGEYGEWSASEDVFGVLACVADDVFE